MEHHDRSSVSGLMIMPLYAYVLARSLNLYRTTLERLSPVCNLVSRVMLLIIWISIPYYCGPLQKIILALLAGGADNPIKIGLSAYYLTSDVR